MTNYSNASKLLKFFYIDLCGNADYSDLTLSEMKGMIQAIEIDYSQRMPIESMLDYFNNPVKSDLAKALELFNTCLETVNCSFNDLEYYEFFEQLENYVSFIRGDHDDDFYIDGLPCGEVRLICEDEIEEIWHDSLIEQIKECYDLSDVPSFVEIDWNATADNCKIDGKGHLFASYDGEEHYSNGFYIFRTN